MSNFPARPGVTLEDVAKAAGVSRSQASRALRNDPGVRGDTKAHILATAASLNYTPNLAAQTLASRQSRTIGLVVGDVLNPYEAMLARECDKALRDAGYFAMLAVSGTAATLRAFIDQRIAGLVLIGAPGEREEIAAVSKLLPTVYIGRNLATETVESVSSDDALGARLATEFLLGLGHRAIAHITGGTGAGANSRANAYRDTMQRQGLKPIIAEGRYDVDAGSAATDALMARKDRPTAIFAANDLIALGVISRLAGHGFRVPDEVAVVGFDDIPMAASEPISLTTIRQKVPDMVAAAVETLTTRLADPSAPIRNLVIAPELIIRRSSGLQI
ncbi:LacI family DNA-binding transcriptional regulator [Agrobacterium genomosp. 3]|uniref:LacI family DNA-binding transcriptional regulator n=1 Tax=Agrobacterium TaxID=357 RepID=UPI001CD8E7FA|nr:LacI family DNA-binding transcriptional regulator [Agrobacterium sp.]MCA1865188.1 LacI family DNA-binding transcriptional regulator [Agrobacterium tomkonis]MCA1875597.1 LacI family DNA-binding transcriptional regulator [Agrobacterium tumefaciens]MCA1891455.1 LacI family DNA-binding transcriptional regulator [Agrobacterium tomkonis]